MRAAIYCRVSSDRQEHEETIQSQLAELRLRVKEDGLDGCPEFLDENYSRDNRVRPGLDRLRDLAAAGELERLYIQCPDRLASGAKLVVLVEEFQQQGVEAAFTKGSVDETPEGKLLLHMQGAIAEFERTKIAERTRRGKLYWARQGAIVGGHCPYGYRFVRRSETSRARLEVDETQAAVVRDIFRWLVTEEMSTRAIAGRLTGIGVPTAGGARQWQPTVVSRILRDPAYYGTFLYQKSERFVSPNSRSSDPYRRNRKTAQRPRPSDDWITIPVPPIVDEDIWRRAQEQLKKNALHSPRNNKRHHYLLKGLLRGAPVVGRPTLATLGTVSGITGVTGLTPRCRPLGRSVPQGQYVRRWWRQPSGRLLPKPFSSPMCWPGNTSADWGRQVQRTDLKQSRSR